MIWVLIYATTPTSARKVVEWSSDIYDSNCLSVPHNHRKHHSHQCEVITRNESLVGNFDSEIYQIIVWLCEIPYCFQLYKIVCIFGTVKFNFDEVFSKTKLSECSTKLKFDIDSAQHKTHFARSDHIFWHFEAIGVALALLHWTANDL